MIATDDVVKLVLAFSIAFAIVVVAVQVARFLSELAGGVRDARKVVHNAGLVTDMAVDDYRQVRKFVGGIANIQAGLPKIWGLLRPKSDNDEEMVEDTAVPA